MATQLFRYYRNNTKTPANVLVVTIHKLEVQTYLQCVLCGCMGAVAKLFLLWRVWRREKCIYFLWICGKRKVFLVFGV